MNQEPTSTPYDKLLKGQLSKRFESFLGHIFLEYLKADPEKKTLRMLLSRWKECNAEILKKLIHEMETGNSPFSDLLKECKANFEQAEARGLAVLEEIEKELLS